LFNSLVFRSKCKHKAEWKKGDEELRKVDKEASLQRAVWVCYAEKDVTVSLMLMKR